MLTTPFLGEVKVVRGQGMPSWRHHDFGNLYIQFDVKFPEKLGGPNGESISPEAIAALENILPRQNGGITPPQDAMIEDYPLEAIDPTRERGRAQGAHLEDDEDEMHAGGERVQCASQ